MTRRSEQPMNGGRQHAGAIEGHLRRDEGGTETLLHHCCLESDFPHRLICIRILSDCFEPHSIVGCLAKPTTHLNVIAWRTGRVWVCESRRGRLGHPLH